LATFFGALAALLGATALSLFFAHFQLNREQSSPA
jgi:hypothetical protein